ncbi:hypothetical protein GW17_00055461 [Ensete ventricosum]|nr:hypothetical protein GW17_00055461 [Ensete ventricosum]
MEEEEGNSNVDCDCVVTSWLQVASVVVRARLQKEEDGATMYTIVMEEGNSGMEREMIAIVFNLLLAVINIVGSEQLLEDGSKRSLLAAFDSKRCMLQLKG